MYEEFKKSLYRSVLQHKRKPDVKIHLFEGRVIYTDEESIHMIKMINLASRGIKDVAVLDNDMLCLSWGNGSLAGLKYWNVKRLHERYQEAGWMGVLPEIVAKMEDEGGEERTAWRTSYEHCRRRHILRPLNYFYNRDELENCVYWRFGDVALVLYDLIFETEEDCTTMKISREMTEEWGIKDDVLLSNALFNTRDRMPPRLFHGNDLRYCCSLGDGVFMPGDGPVNVQIEEQEGMQGYRLTTTRQINGAIALFYPYVKEQLAWMMKGDFYVGFPSIHEAVIHPVRCKVLSEMKAAIHHTNIIFDEREMLTNRVYRYMSSRQELLEV